MCLLYVSFGSKVKPRTCGCEAMGSVMLLILNSMLLLSAGSGVTDCKLFCVDVVQYCYVLIASLGCTRACVDVMVMSSALVMTLRGALGAGMYAA